jgi:hypothetical protein
LLRILVRRYGSSQVLGNRLMAELPANASLFATSRHEVIISR